jgi:hypothetical protein
LEADPRSSVEPSKHGGGTGGRTAIEGYIHVALAPGWREIFYELLSLLSDSGLREASKVIHVGLLGPDPQQFDYSDRSLNPVPLGTRIDQFEFPTLDLLRQRCYDSDAPNLVYYLHLKGLTRPNHPSVASWRRYMAYFAIERHKDCISALRSADICGVNWLRSPWPHFSGNFWWSRSEYVKLLAAARSLPDSKWPERFKAERWIGSRPGVRATSLHQSGVDHYRTDYPRARYVLKESML